MTATVNITYRPEEARFRAEFVRNNKVVDYKYLTEDEHEALDIYYGVPMDTRVLKLNAKALDEYMGSDQLPMDPDSNFVLMLNHLLRK